MKIYKLQNSGSLFKKNMISQYNIFIGFNQKSVKLQNKDLKDLKKVNQ